MTQTLMAQDLEEALKAKLDADENPMTKAAAYSLLSGGKRLRPKLLMTTGELFGADMQACLDAACAIEMIHTYSLIHDDLPAMDDDDLRRGKPTLHKAYDEATAILAGDYLLTKAFGVIGESPHITDAQKVKLITLFSEKAGGQGMIGGQMLDIQGNPDLLKIHAWKTGALMEGAVRAGAHLASCNSFCEEKLALFAAKIGLAFQVIDDVIDVETPEALLGKSSGSDAKKNKPTSVQAWGVKGAKEKAEELLEEGLLALRAFPVNTDSLQSLAKELVRRAR